MRGWGGEGDKKWKMQGGRKDERGRGRARVKTGAGERTKGYGTEGQWEKVADSAFDNIDHTCPARPFAKARTLDTGKDQSTGSNADGNTDPNRKATTGNDQHKT